MRFLIPSIIKSLCNSVLKETGETNHRERLGMKAGCAITCRESLTPSKAHTKITRITAILQLYHIHSSWLESQTPGELKSIISQSSHGDFGLQSCLLQLKLEAYLAAVSQTHQQTAWKQPRKKEKYENCSESCFTHVFQAKSYTASFKSSHI